MDDRGTVRGLGRVVVDHLRMEAMESERKWHGDIQDEISILHQQHRERRRDFMSACVVLISKRGKRCAC